ncbi:hypothetical protein Tco_1134641 [Tanacetum coccineum]
MDCSSSRLRRSLSLSALYYHRDWDQQVVSELVALRNFARRYGSRFCTHGGCIHKCDYSANKRVEFELWWMRMSKFPDDRLCTVDKAQRRLEVKTRITLKMGIPNEHQLKFNSIKDAKLFLEAVEKRFGGNTATKNTQRNLLKQQYENFTALSLEMLDQTFDRLQNLVSQLELLDEKLSQENINQKLLRSLSPEWNTHAVVWRNKADLDTLSMNDLYNNLKVYEPEVKGMPSSSSSTQNMAFVSSSNNNTNSTNEAVNTAHGVSTASTQVNAANFTNIDNLSDAVICSFFSSQPNSPQLAHEDLQQIRWKLTVNGNETIGFDKSKLECYNCHKRGHFARSAELQEIKTTRTKKSQEGVCLWKQLILQLWCHVMVLVDMTGVSNDSNCSKSCMETVKLLKSQNDQLLRDLKKSSLMVLGYKTGLESVEEKLEFYKKNEFVYVENINGLKWDIQVGEITIRELRKKLEKIQKEKDSIQFNVDKFENASKSLDKLIEYEFVNKPVVENRKSDEEVSKVVRKSDDSLIIEDWASDSEEENVSQTKTEKKIVKPSISKIEFVKPKQQEKTARKTVKQVEKHRQNTHTVSVNTARQVNTAHSKTTVNAARPMSYLSKIAHSTVKRLIHKNTSFKNININQRGKNLNTARPKVVVNVVKGNNVNAVKASACWIQVSDGLGPQKKLIFLSKVQSNPQIGLQDQGVIDSGCSRHMTGNMSYLTNYEEIDGGYVAFGGNPKGGKITGKAKKSVKLMMEKLFGMELELILVTQS